MQQNLVAVRNSSLHNSARRSTFQARTLSGQWANFPRSELGKRLYKDGNTYVLRPNGYQLYRQGRYAG